MTGAALFTGAVGARKPSILDATFPGDGEMSKRCRELDWAATPVGPVDGWPQSLRTLVSTLLRSRIPSFSPMPTTDRLKTALSDLTRDRKDDACMARVVLVGSK